MSSDHYDESELSALRTGTPVDASAAVDATNALRDRLRLRLTVNNMTPGTTLLSPEPVRNEPGERVWNSVLESLSTSLHTTGSQQTVTSSQPLAAHPFMQQPLTSPAQAMQSTPQSGYSRQPLDMHYGSAPTHQHASVHTAGGQIFVPAGVVEYPDAHGNVALLAPSQPQVDSSLYISGPNTIVAPNIGGTGVPYLGQPVRPASPQRVVASRVAAAQISAQAMRQKKKRHPFRAFFSFLVVASLLAGAGFTGWYFLIKKKVTWTDEVLPLATFVEDTTHAKFVENVGVTTLSVPEYEVKLGIDVLARSYIDPDGSFATLRAAGLVSGVPAPSEVGHLAAVTMTAFYSSNDKTIYRLEGGTPAFELATIRALTVALADQESGWSKNSGTLTDAQNVGIRAAVDGVGVEVVRARFRRDPQLEGLVAFEVQARTTAAGIVTSAAPTYLNAVLGSYFFGAHASPAPAPDHLMAAVYTPGSDAPLFDPSRSSTSPATVVASPTAGATARTLGMQFWYLVLLPAIGAADARTAALTWTGDSSVTTTTDGHSCLAANVSTTSAAEQATLAAALGRWAATRPASSAALIATPVENLVNVSVCEPLEPSSQPIGPVDATLLYSASSQEGAAAANLVRLGLPETQGAWSCAIAMVRGGALPNFVEGSADPVQAAAMSNVLTYCKTA